MAHLRAMRILPYSSRPTLHLSRISPRLNAVRFRYPSLNEHATRSLSWVPLVFKPSFWKSMVPRPFRQGVEPENQSASPQIQRHREWNPATYFIVIFLLIGSQAIQTLNLHKDFDKFSRETETKLALLRDVVERVRKGEDVDVKKALGTGDPKAEKEWKDVIRELEDEDSMIQSRRKRQKARRAEKEQEQNAGAS